MPSGLAPEFDSSRRPPGCARVEGGEVSNESIKQVLVVDDEHDIRTVARIALATIAGWEATLAEGGVEALRLARDTDFDVVLLDVMMPGMDGLETLRLLRKMRRNTPVIMVTAKAQRHEIASYFDAGAAGVITKPFDPMTLADRVRDLVGANAKRASRAGALASRLAKLREGYVRRLPDKLREIEAAREALQLDSNEDTRKALRTLAHKLHGTGGSYGLRELSEAAGILERCLLDTAADVAAEEVDGAVESLRQVVAKACMET
jgi:DNA-binding response OmpR family regulator